MIHKIGLLLLAAVTAFSLSACTQQFTQETGNIQQGGFIKLAPGAYDSADTAVVISKQEKQKTITFFNLIKNKNYTLNYDGLSHFYDKYGSAISVSQLKEGEMVEINFLKENKLLTDVKVSNNVWSMDNVSKFEMDLANGKLNIMNKDYNVDKNTVIISGGKRAELMDINSQDTLRVIGKDLTIYSIIVEKGHGYLRLANEEYFIGGWIEVGQKLIQKIEKNMLMAVPEGSYTVHLSHSGIEGTKEVVIERDKETKLDVGDLRKEDMIKYGTLIFTIEPSDAQVYLDGKSVDITRSVKTEYGLHQIMAKAEGYETVIQYIRVAESSANVAIALDEAKERTEKSETSVSGNTTSSVTTPTDNSTQTTPSTETNSNTNTSSDSEKKNTETNSNTNTSSDSEKKNTETEEKKENDTVSSNDTDSSNDTVSSNDTDSSDDTVSGSSTTEYKVTIEAPEDAEIYVDGTYVGIVPASFSKKAGSHVVTVRKTGYMTRSYTIEVDGEDKDISYSFSDLTPIE